MRAARRFVIPAAMLLLFLAAPASAQYMRITTDNPADNTRMRGTGTTTLLTITLNTNHDRNGLLQTCNSHTAACGAPSSGQPLDMFGYTLALKASGGTVSWGTFTPSDAAYTDTQPPISNSTEIEINQFRPTGTVTSPGLVTIGTLPVTVISGTPSVGLQVGAGALNPFGFGTGFATDCDGFFFANFYVVGDPSDPCGTVSGAPGDWFDWDGASAPCQGCNDTPPVITAPATASAVEGTAMTPINATATDADAANTLTITQVGMPADLTFTTNSPGVTPRSASISGTPGFADAGSHNIVWTVNDGTGGANATNTVTTVLTIANTNRAPTLNPIANMNVNVGGCAGVTADQAISGSDPDGDPLTFSKVSGPTFMTVTTTSPTTGNIHLAPSSSDGGTYPATAQASDGLLTNQKSFTITVGTVNQGPTLNQPTNMTVSEGATANQTLTATAPCNAPLTFSKVSGPSFLTVTTTNPGTGSATGNLHLAPSVGDQGTYFATIAVSDGSSSNQKGLVITVNPTTDRPPTLDPISNMSTCGIFPDQTVTGSDPDGDPLTFTKAAGPTYMTVTNVSPTAGNIHLAPGASEPTGTVGATVRASDGTLSVDRSFTITLQLSNCPPTLAPINNMFLAEGSTQDQTVTGHDANGNPLDFSKASGPAFMTVTTISPGIGTATGNIHLAPGFTDAGTYSAAVQVSDGSLSTQGSFTISVCNSCGRAPVLDPIADMTVTEGTTLDQAVTGTDPDGDPLTFFKASGPIFMTVSTVNATTGHVHLTPGFADAGTYSAAVGASDGTLSSTRGFAITALTSGNRCPVANPASRYSGIVGVPLTFNGTLSSDLDGNPLSYAWDFDASNGITVDATGALASHVYAVAGTYTVTLTVTDNGDGDPAQICSNSATTTAVITGSCDATVFNGYDTIRLGSGKPFWFGYVQPAFGCYANSDVIISTFVMKYAGRQISASGKTDVGGDKNGDGIPEIKVSFSKEDLRTLFAGTGLSNGHNTVTVALEALLVTGGNLHGTTQLDVVNNGNFTVATVSPNPLNPEATLTFTTSRQGPVRVDLFDIQGRLVRRLVDESALAAGTHDVTIDGRGTHGEKLPSGVYYVRGTSPEGEFKQLITILK